MSVDKKSSQRIIIAMVKAYKNGNDFISENAEFLNTNILESEFFFLDAPLIKETDRENYVLRVSEEDRIILVLKIVPYNLMFFGSKDLVGSFIDYALSNGLDLGAKYLCEDSLGKAYASEVERKTGRKYVPVLSMDIMRATDITIPSCSVEVPTSDDLDEIFEMKLAFTTDCNLLDPVRKEIIAKMIPDYRILREDGKIVCMARRCREASDRATISDVYTRPEYRCKGLAKKLVNTLKNQILEDGKDAVLNVDKNNPVSNHIYCSIGFKIVSPMTEFRLI